MNTGAVNPALRIRPRKVLSDTCLVIDEFFRFPKSLRQLAVDHADEFSGNNRTAYPGLELPFPAGLVDDLDRWWRRTAPRFFPVLRGGMQSGARFGLTSTPPEKLAPLQRVCHQDHPPKGRPSGRGFAAVVYLFEDARLGGTGFYAQRPGVDYRRIVAAYSSGSESALNSQSPFFRTPPRYMTASNELFELVDVVHPAFNRAVFYPSDIYHSGHIEHPELLSTSPETGRLTINFFSHLLLSS